MAGSELFKKEEASINRWSIRLTVDDKDSVRFSPWDTSGYRMKVEAIPNDPIYPNTFSIVDDGFNTYKTFLLCYKYTDPNDGKTYEMREELRLAFNKRDEQ
jgi:hypothetical protein